MFETLYEKIESSFMDCKDQLKAKNISKNT